MSKFLLVQGSALLLFSCLSVGRKPLLGKIIAKLIYFTFRNQYCEPGPVLSLAWGLSFMVVLWGSSCPCNTQYAWFSCLRSEPLMLMHRLRALEWEVQRRPAFNTDKCVSF